TLVVQRGVTFAHRRTGLGDRRPDYHGRMNPATSTHSLIGRWGRQASTTWRGWWHVVHMGAQIVVLALSPSVYTRNAHRSAVLTHLYAATAPLLTWFLVLSALVSLVLIRIVVAT